ncbi:hypothetical protein HPL003_06775 [Paenibacillus terrae HPL-003]|uniref:Uncharacterized protein n=1 Tax=Paenibacillus terrae (strain HPL-003) TaxID=985665 RepID=G7W3N1_PAETH|nr:hypothetical protein HPL003_06775 [Paenibacillus terrae HPL-003]
MADLYCQQALVTQPALVPGGIWLMAEWLLV